MIYCSVNEAYDNNIDNKMIQQEQQNHNKRWAMTDQIEAFQNNNYIDPPHEAGMINKIKNWNKKHDGYANPYPQIYPNFFDAQGDINNHSNRGTKISDIKKAEEETLSDFSDDDISLLTNKKQNIRLDHQYCINKFVNNILEANDMISFGSSDDGEVYKHVKSCSFCKKEINNRMKENLDDKSIKEDKSFSHTVENFGGALGYDIKEILIIVLAGIVLIFILDLLVRIGKRLK